MRKIIFIKDPIYGDFKITSPAIIHLIESKPVQRLKKISQFGPPDKYYHLKNYSRYEHSIGVMLILIALKATEEEQIAGLLHDISHTAFSHVIDWILDSGQTEDYQDKNHSKFIENKDIKDILVEYGFDPLRIKDCKRFKLLEKEIPDLCADRIDYALKEFSLPAARECFSSLMTYRHKIVFKDKESALLFADNFLEKQVKHWGGFEAVARYTLFAKVLKYALDDQIIVFGDLMNDEKTILEKIEDTSDGKIKQLLFLLEKKDLSFLPKSKKIAYKKFRYVDPEFLDGNNVVRLSSVDKDFKEKIKKAKTDNKKGVIIPLI
jgi:uncharacterized protein